LVVLAWLVGLASRGCEAVQMRIVLHNVGIQARTWDVLVGNSLSTLYGMVLPGDVAASFAKWSYLSKITGKKSGVFNGIVYNRLMSIAPWLIGGVIAVLTCNFLPTAYLRPTLSVLVGLLVGVAILYSKRLATLVDRLVLRFSGRLLPHGVHQRIEYVIQSLDAFRQLPLLCHAKVFAISSVVALLTCVFFSLMATAAGAHVPLLAVAWVLCMLMVVKQFPISFQGIGVREATLIVLLGTFGVAKQTAFALGMLLFTHVVIFAIVGLVFQVYLTFRPLRPVSPFIK